MEQLINSGLSIKDALEVSALINNKKSNISMLLYEQIKKGISFADAVNNLNMIFPPVYRGIISVGDKVGSIEKIFPRLRQYLETQKKIKDKIQGAMLYPIIVLITAFICFIGMIFFVFPKLKTMFIEFGGEAAIILDNNISKIEKNSIIFLILFCILIFTFLFLKYISKKKVELQLKLDSILLEMPILGKFLTYHETLNFSFAMETLISGGISVEDAIKESNSVLINTAYKNALNDIRMRITKGETLSTAFNIHKKIFPEYMIKWIMVVEKSGKTEQVFAQLRNYFHNEIDLYTTRFMTLIEPSLIILIGLFLVVIILNVIVPVFSLYGSIL